MSIVPKREVLQFKSENKKVVLDIISKIKKISASLVLELRCSGEKSLKLCLKSLDVYSS